MLPSRSQEEGAITSELTLGHFKAFDEYLGPARADLERTFEAVRPAGNLTIKMSNCQIEQYFTPRFHGMTIKLKAGTKGTTLTDVVKYTNEEGETE